MNGIDCATKLTSASAQALKQAGVEVVGRYLGRNLWNGLTLDEVKAIQGAGLALFLILELSPTKAAYFSYAKGVSDAQFALAEAEYLGAPKGIAIYFTVDYEAQPQDMAAINEYLHGVHSILTGKYLVGIYGSYAVMIATKGASYPPDRYFQTLAWSYGKKAPNHIYQATNGTELAGINVDVDYVNDDAGLWGPTGSYQVQSTKEDEDVMDVCVVYFTPADFSEALIVANENGGCAMFCRNGGASVHADAKKAKKIINIGGPELKLPGEVWLSGDKAKDTLKKVAATL